MLMDDCQSLSPQNKSYYFGNYSGAKGYRHYF